MSINDLFKKANKLFTQNNYIEGLKIYKDILFKYPQNVRLSEEVKRTTKRFQKTIVQTITDKEISRYYQGIEHLLHLFYEKTDIKFSGVYRCKLNLQYQVADYDKDNYQCPHMDQVFDHKVLIYYPFTSDGDTFLFNQV